MISIWYVLLLAIAVAVLTTTLVFTARGNIRLQKDIEHAEIDIANMQRTIDIQAAQIRGLEKELSFREGLQAGRKTDTLYRQLLKKYTDKEQFTVMMNGTKEGISE